MHLLYFVQYFPPENAAGLPLVLDLINGFADHGWKVDLYTSTPTRGVDDATRRKYNKIRKEILKNGSITIHRMPLYREGKSFAQRTVRYSIFSLQCFFVGLFVPADAIFSGSAPPTQGVIISWIKKFTKKKFIYNPQDLFPDSMIIAGKISEESKIAKVGRWMERVSFKAADAIITITDDMAKNIKSITANKNIHVVRNWIDTDKTVPVPREENPLFDELKLHRDKFYVTYAGNLGMVQGVETIIKAAEKLRDNEDIQFVIFGNGSEEDHIKEMASSLSNVKIFPLQPLSRVSEVYSLGDISIVSCKAGTGSAGMPSKTWTIMATGTAIVGSFDIGSELDKTLQSAECGVCVKADDSMALAVEIEALYEKPETVKTMGRNARRYAVSKVSKDRAVKEYIDIIEQSMRGHKSASHS